MIISNTFTAEFGVKLRTPIRTMGEPLRPLEWKPTGDVLRKVIVAGVSDPNGFISTLHVKCTYSGAGLNVVNYAGSEAIDVFDSDGAGMLVPPFTIGQDILSPLLYYLSAITLQGTVYYRIEDYLTSSIVDFNWTLPDGKRLPSGCQKYSGYPGRVVRDVVEAGTRGLTANDWQTLQVRPVAIALWKMIFADALRERINDPRVTIIHCATALDVAAQEVLPAGVKFDMKVLRGENPASGVCDLRTEDAKLYQDLSELWYTRHGIVHRGEVKCYIDNPIKLYARSRPLNGNDVERFLIAVPKAIAYLNAQT